MASIIPVSFIGGHDGEWRVERMVAVAGAPLPAVAAVSVASGHRPDERAVAPAALPAPPAASPLWILRGTNGHARYVERREDQALRARQEGLGRPQATAAALIPIRKSQAWWDLTQDERRAIFEGESRHIAATLKYLPAVARRLYQSRELGEPFDFLTWFEFAPEHAGLFDELLALLRASPEWRYVEREVEVRLVRV